MSKSRPRAFRAAERRGGFSLFEVLAAVAILALTVTMLARGAIQGMGYEGDASRRFTASLIADQLLFEERAAGEDSQGMAAFGLPAASASTPHRSVRSARAQL